MQIARTLALQPTDSALQEAGRAVAANIWNPEARSLLSHLLLDRGLDGPDPELLREAEFHAQRAVELDPMTPHHWQHLARVRFARHDPLGAFIALQRATELYPIKIEYRNDRDRVGAALARQVNQR